MEHCCCPSGTGGTSLPFAGEGGKDLPLIGGDVTIEHLLAHRSGIGDYLDEDDGHQITDYVLTVPAHDLAATGHSSGSNRAVKWRSRLGWETIRMPGRSQAR
jgi:CubicO group peptidase (beta-lactamase class C family)